ncbi:hypothetical protein, partial [Streptomyces phaeochromogenes]
TADEFVQGLPIGGGFRVPAIVMSGVYRNTARSLLSGGIDGIASWIRCVRVWRIHLAAPLWGGEGPCER